MEQRSPDKLHIPPSFSAGTSSSLTTKSLQCTTSATGNPRNKCALKQGHSLMDWIRLGNSGADLSGTGGSLMLVSEEDLAKHNTINDAWMAIGGVVYNVTRYLDFHPGGVEELMRGVGSDGTKLFNETHAWVNYSQLLNKCVVGSFTKKVKCDSRLEKSSIPPNESLFVKPSRFLQQDILPRLDWIQQRDNITLSFYTKQFCNPGSVIRNLFPEDCRIEIWIIIGLHVHKYEFELEGRIKWPPKSVKISSESGKIELQLNKHDEDRNLWSDLGKYKRSKNLASALDLEKHSEFKIFYKDKFNIDSFIMALKNENVVYNFPVAYHIMIEDFVNGIKINKCYTPVPKNYVERYINIEMDMEYIYFLIKYYPNSTSYAQYLCNLRNDTTIKLSLPKGNLKLSALATHRKFCFLAAGSGLTPFLSLIDHLLNRNTNRIEAIKLCYFNKTIRDIWCNEILKSISTKDGRFDFVNILSNADESWSGLTGRVSSELLFPIVNKTIEKVSYIAACGPFDFITSVENILKELHFPCENLFIF